MLNTASNKSKNPEEPLQVPIVDFGSYLNGDKPAQEKVAQDVLTVLKEFGQMALVNHGISQEELDGLFAESQKFFALSTEEKKQYAYTTQEANRGYLGTGAEKIHYGMEDIKETMEFGKEGEEGMPNPWPKELPEFKQTVSKLFNKLDNLQLQILGCLEVAFKVPKGTITNKCSNQHENMRLLHYPGVHSSKIGASLKAKKRCADHTDYGTITLLMQDNVGGLQLQLQDGTWIDVIPVKGAIVVQVADMLERWTNGVLHAARHRVITPNYHREYDGMLPDRYSIAFFCNPDKDAIIEALPSTYDDANPRLYKPFNAMDYITLRLKASI